MQLQSVTSDVGSQSTFGQFWRRMMVGEQGTRLLDNEMVEKLINTFGLHIGHITSCVTTLTSIVLACILLYFFSSEYA
jgi:hypothetical protein